MAYNEIGGEYVEYMGKSSDTWRLACYNLYHLADKNKVTAKSYVIVYGTDNQQVFHIDYITSTYFQFTCPSADGTNATIKEMRIANDNNFRITYYIKTNGITYGDNSGSNVAGIKFRLYY